MTISIVAVGKIKEKYMTQAINDYVKRLGRYGKVEIVEVNEETSVEKEGENLLNRIPKGSYVIVLDLYGKEIDSVEFAQVFEKAQINGYSRFSFVIGGSEGISDEVRKQADMLLCLSKMTFTHQMARFIFLEQIYRAMKINNNEPYHK
ncbi:MAG TPA: 23S rRNA (pseudouridine(1915)-N(3))-methyltransferase RlmH [Clostridia bacterium]|jgi:23S rRNA (pseudouridine1915-N3)-methyltransferase|nr:23S rRNA (pseudouridine(1915)-N(3))-methyltransferase RlmH [Clostridia bacterium]HPZ52212.1 23S rRNA (pseudouridine(1915)-N(3))-methyltransferase RlmH [Clostridia bacterium]